MEFKDYYKVLGLERNAAQDAIKPAWERAANRDKSSAHRPIGMQASSSQVAKVQEQSSATSLKRYLEKCGKANRPRPAGMRLKGRGIPAAEPGDLYATLKIVLPPADSKRCTGPTLTG